MTPYMHAAAYHVGYVLETHGNIRQFSGQGKLQCSAVHIQNELKKQRYLK